MNKLTFPITPSSRYALPKLSYLGKLFSIEEPYTTGYSKVLEALFKLFPKSRNFYNYRAGETGPDYLRIKNIDALKQAEALQEGDWLILPCDLKKYKGKSVDAVREESKNELLLSSFHVASILLQDETVLPGPAWEGLDCAGDEYDWSAGGQWASCPCFRFYGAEVRFGAGAVDSVNARFGAASAFLGSVPRPLYPWALVDPLEVRINGKNYVSTDQVLVSSIGNLTTEELLAEVKRRME